MQGGDSREAFRGLAIEFDPSYESHLNRHNVIKLDIAGICADQADPIESIRDEIDERDYLLRNHPEDVGLFAKSEV